MDHGKIASSTRRGFTLVEILVAMVVLVLMVALLAQVLSFAQVGLGNLGNSALRRQDAGTVLANMAKDLRAALQPMNRSYEGADPLAGQFQLLINPSGVVNVGTVNVCNPNTIFWSTSAANSVGGSGLVGYVVRWGTTPSGAPQPLLCRMFLNTAQATPQLTTIQTNAAPNQWASTALVTNYAPANLNNGYQGWLADNVIALYVRALDPGMNPITKYAQAITGMAPTDQYAGGQACLSIKFANAPGASSQNQYDSRQGYEYISSGNTIDRYGPVLPAAIEIAIVAASPKDIGRLSTALASSVYNYNASSDMWTNINTFMTNLPSPLIKSARVYSTIVTP